MACELQIPVIAAGGAALVAEDHLDQIPVHRSMIRPDPPHQFGNIQGGLALAGEAINGKAGAGFELLAERVF